MEGFCDFCLAVLKLIGTLPQPSFNVCREVNGTFLLSEGPCSLCSLIAEFCRQKGIYEESALLRGNSRDNVTSLYFDGQPLSWIGCRQTIGGQNLEDNEVDLPQRVLALKGEGPDFRVKLVEGNGTRDRYCALSHCWGTGNNLPLRTLRSNLHDHFADIPFEKLPRSFQDALRVTRAVGMKYVWIDSLCIIQDDPNDWEREAKTIGSLYEKATMIIAAAGARDSTEGCFQVIRPGLSIIEVPYVDEMGEITGSFNVAMLPSEDVSPAFGPLYFRGWACQEWNMSRRTLFFMPVVHHTNWEEFLYHYTECFLTFPSDRLAAIEGIATARAKACNEKYMFGTWEGNPFQLLWRVRAPGEANETLAGVPSWSWAATGGSKFWPFRGHLGTDSDAVHMCKSLKFGDLGNLIGEGLFIAANVEKCLIRLCCFDNSVLTDIYNFNAERSSTDESSTGFSFWAEFDHRWHFRIGEPTPLHLMFSQGNHRKAIGLATFDGKSASNVTCLLLASKPRWDPSMKLDRDELWNRMQHAWNTLRKCKDDDCINLLEICRGDMVYWALLLEPVEEQPNTFKRIGMALLYPEFRNSVEAAERAFKVI
ncbi:hypothetical protein JX265_007156 [Neoarthrinium moseri]|uniref:Heterokaryon incompatibility domain-containing protein n=1 Tax=Neoarthrinium moseri TaxID=1658444 RepID=A0A9Q0APU4_9PEZI|nr:hypothetical protein JX265_007156 [Neoarthrinium moseri]